ncbi:unnamed protein product [Linum tenue]|uniref:O-methyltransferase C-terminal domain-containing protein n=1 Tax=Linum tenue TaxID=586396 RepID=A0AAV0HQ71_9ROSI|nr:unnamed protein product [Linum tenue]CAI0388196.1 unnamed protein product [Linum tenue]
MSFWDAMAREPSLMQTFYGAMSGDSKLVARVLVSDCCKELFRGVGSLVDVGGGTGTMAAAIARAYPDINCTVFELPQVVPDSQDQEAIIGLPNLQFLGGNMFQENIPHGDALLLKVRKFHQLVISKFNHLRTDYYNINNSVIIN